MQYEQVMTKQKASESTWAALRRLWKQERLTGFYRGYLPGLIGISHGTIQFMLYEQMANYYNRWYLDRPDYTKLVCLFFYLNKSMKLVVFLLIFTLAGGA